MASMTYERWVDYIFVKAACDAWDPDDGLAIAVSQLSEEVFTEYLLKLLRNPRPVTDKYSDDALADGLSELFSSGAGGYFTFLIETYTPFELVSETLDALANFYRELLDPRCCGPGALRDWSVNDASKLEGQVYMLWDMGGPEAVLDVEPGRQRTEVLAGGAGLILAQPMGDGLCEVGFNALERILMESRGVACQISALHGLGHAHHLHPDFPSRVEGIIDRFLSERTAPPGVVEYAGHARRGCVE